MSIGLVVGLIIVFAVFRYARALIGRQQLRPRRLRARIALSCVVGAVVILTSASHAEIALGGVAGVAAGAALAWVAIRLTTIERTESATFYRPNLYLGIAVFALWLGRFLFRLATVAPTLTSGAGASARSAQLVSDPVTAATYMVLIAYFACYSALLLRM